VSVTGSGSERSEAPRGATDAAVIPILHAVTSDEIAARADFLDRARRVMHAGGTRIALHLRVQRFGGKALYELACRLVEMQNATGAWLVINDRADVALSAGARGVQLTSRSMSPADARRAAPALPVGASVHSLEDAAEAVEAGARWLVAAHAFDTETQPPDHDGRGIAFIERLVAAHTIPVIAIGGIRPAHVPLLRAAGAYGVAVIRGVWHASDAGAAVIDYLSAHGEPGGR
jgi:thiamine-phosphate diphosphorylase